MKNCVNLILNLENWKLKLKLNYFLKVSLQLCCFHFVKLNDLFTENLNLLSDENLQIKYLKQVLLFDCFSNLFFFLPELPSGLLRWRTSSWFDLLTFWARSLSLPASVQHVFSSDSDLISENWILTICWLFQFDSEVLLEGATWPRWPAAWTHSSLHL